MNPIIINVTPFLPACDLISLISTNKDIHQLFEREDVWLYLLSLLPDWMKIHLRDGSPRDQYLQSLSRKEPFIGMDKYYSLRRCCYISGEYYARTGTKLDIFNHYAGKYTHHDVSRYTVKEIPPPSTDKSIDPTYLSSRRIVRSWRYASPEEMFKIINLGEGYDRRIVSSIIRGYLHYCIKDRRSQEFIRVYTYAFNRDCGDLSIANFVEQELSFDSSGKSPVYLLLKRLENVDNRRDILINAMFSTISDRDIIDYATNAKRIYGISSYPYNLHFLLAYAVEGGNIENIHYIAKYIIRRGDKVNIWKYGQFSIGSCEALMVYAEYDNEAFVNHERYGINRCTMKSLITKSFKTLNFSRLDGVIRKSGTERDLVGGYFVGVCKNFINKRQYEKVATLLQHKNIFCPHITDDNIRNIFHVTDRDGVTREDYSMKDGF